MNKAILLAVASAMAFVGPSQAGPFSFIEDAIKAPLAPVEDTIRIIKGDDPKDVVTDRIDTTGEQIERATDAAQMIQDTVYSVKREAISNTLGEDWARGYDSLTALDRVRFEMEMTSGRFLGGCLRGEECSVEKLTAMPLAAALRDAYKVYWPYSAPLHPAVVDELSPVLPWPVIASARITIGDTPDMTVPGLLNAGHEVAGHGHAVTIGNVIIFSRQIDFEDCDDFEWLLHELQHVAQYMSHSRDVLESIDGFAVDYMYSYSSLEDEAEATGAAWMRDLDGYHGYGCFN